MRSHVCVVLLMFCLAAVAHAQPTEIAQFGHGLIRPGFDVPSTIFTSLIEVRDFDEDGNADCLFAFGEDRTVRVVLGDDQGDYELRLEFSPFARDAIAIGNMSRNGPYQIFTRSIRSNTVTRWFGEQSDISSVEEFNLDFFYEQAPEALPDEFAPYIRTADLDRDGKADYLFNSSGSKLLVRWSSRPGNSRYETIELPMMGQQNVLYVIRDYDADGELDALLYDYDAERFVLVRGTGTNSMGQVVELSPSRPSVAMGHRPAFGQFDDDPAIDMALQQGNQIIIAANFAAQTAPDLEIADDSTLTLFNIAADFNRSGVDDLLFAREQDVLLITDPLHPESELIPFLLTAPDGVVTYDDDYQHPVDDFGCIDLDHDGDPELIPFGLADSDGARFYENRSEQPGIPIFGSTVMAFDMLPLAILPRDLNGDQQNELVISGTGGTRYIDPVDGSVTQFMGATNAALGATLADLDADGLPELVQANAAFARLLIYPVAADGTVGPRTVVDSPSGSMYSHVISADFDNDGHDDIATTIATSPFVEVFRGLDGPGLQLLDTIPDTGTGSPVHIDTNDINNDGYPDLAVGRTATDLVELYLNDGDGTFTLGNTVPAAYPYYLKLADMDQDGNMDLVTADYRDLVTVHFLDHDQNVEETVDLHCNIIGIQSSAEFVLEDWLGNGLLGLAGVAWSSSSNIESDSSLWVQAEPRVFKRWAIMDAGDSTAIALSDVNQDGGPDLIIGNYNTFDLHIFYGDAAPCPADLNADGELNFFDVSQFLVNQPDYNSDGVFNFFDVAGFIADYLAGCP